MLSEIIRGNDLSYEGAYQLLSDMGNKSPVNIAAEIVAMQSKGYTGNEIAGFAQAMRDKAVQIDLGSTADTCGTGGDRSSTINVSTASSILLSCFHPVAKHGNSSVTSKSGSSNAMQHLGVSIENDLDSIKKGMEACQYAYLHAPLFHPSLKSIMPVRATLGIKTIFNVIGPLCNPARPDYQMIGISDYDLMEKMAEALSIIGVKRAVVVHSRGLDEVHPSKRTYVCEVNKKQIENYVVAPSDFGLGRTSIVPCDGPPESAERIESVLAGRGIREDQNIIILNASMALHAASGRELAECREMVEAVLGDTAIKRLGMIRDAYPL